MPNRRELVFSAGKALVLLPAAVTCDAFTAKSQADEFTAHQDLASYQDQGSESFPDQVRRHWLCAGRAAIASHCEKNGQ